MLQLLQKIDLFMHWFDNVSLATKFISVARGLLKPLGPFFEKSLYNVIYCLLPYPQMHLYHFKKRREQMKYSFCLA